jgi:cytochrome b561
MMNNTPLTYGAVAIFLHWIMALGIFFLFGLGLYMVELSYYDAWYKGSLELHKSIGVSLFILWCVRMVWRLINVSPAMQKANTNFEKFEQHAAHWMHLLLYLLMVLLMSSGYLISTADGRGISVFEFFEVPAITALIENQEDIAGEIHLILAWSLIGCVTIHSLAAIKHHFINKDDTFKKMIACKK